jgi:hypothetical protein
MNEDILEEIKGELKYIAETCMWVKFVFLGFCAIIIISDLIKWIKSF